METFSRHEQLPLHSNKCSLCTTTHLLLVGLPLCMASKHRQLQRPSTRTISELRCRCLHACNRNQVGCMPFPSSNFSPVVLRLPYSCGETYSKDVRSSQTIWVSLFKSISRLRSSCSWPSISLSVGILSLTRSFKAPAPASFSP